MKKLPIPFIVIMVLAIVGIAYFASSSSSGPVAYTERGVVVSAPTDLERVGKALDALGRERVSFDASDRIQRRGGKILVDDLDKVTGLPEGQEVAGIFDDAELVTLLEGKDEAAVAEYLAEKGVKQVVLHQRAAASVDRGKTVFSRLYHHDFLERMSLFWVGEGLLFYEVLEKPVGFNPQLAAVSMAYLRARLKGQRIMGFPDYESETGEWTLIVALRTNGRELSTAFAKDKKLSGALEEVAGDLERHHRRYVEPTGFPPLSDHIDDVTIEIHRVSERAYVEPRGEEWLQEFWEMGIDGAYIMTADNDERAVLPGSASYTQSMRSADAFLRGVAKMGKMSERRPWRDPDAWLEVIRTVHYREDKDHGLAFLYRGVPAVPYEMVTVEAVRQGVIAAGDWYLANLLPNGQVVYKMWPSENRYSNEYNLVRHTLATWNLVQAWEMDKEREDFLVGARKALDFTEQYLVREPVPGGDGEMMAYYSFNNNQKLGTVVVNLLGMVDLARATESREWDAQLVEMGNFVKFMQLETGTYDGYYVDESHPYYGQQNDIVPGEAALSLIYLANYFDDDEWISGLPKYWDYYYDWFPERVAKADWDAPWPAHTYDNDIRLELVQFGPWTVMAANAYHERTGDEKVAQFGLDIARWMIDAYQWSGDNSPFPDYRGGYYKLPGELPAMQAFCYAEGTAAAYQLALRYKLDEASYFEEHTRETARFGLQMQYYPSSTYAFTRPWQVLGGIRYAMNETKVRVDYVHHGLSAMYQWVKAAPEDPNLSDMVKNGPALPMQMIVPKPPAGEDGVVPDAWPEGEEPEPVPAVWYALKDRKARPLPVRMLRRDPNAVPTTPGYKDRLPAEEAVPE